MQDETIETKRFVVGLGNPGRKYARTRHNVGFRVLDALCERWSASAGRSAFGGQLFDARPSRGESAGRRVMLLEPQTYMNRSGQPAGDMVSFYKASPQDLLVVLDDTALPLGQLRARPGGSAGGHKGLANVLERLGTDRVARLRVGIGSPPASWDVIDFVLSKFREDEEEIIEVAIRLAAEAVEDWVFDGIDSVMNRYNRRPEA